MNPSSFDTRSRLSALGGRFPDLAARVGAAAPAPLTATRGGETIRLPDADGRPVTLYNPRDPDAEARSLVDQRLGASPASPVVVLGVGGGHALRIVLERAKSNDTVIGVVVNAAVFRRVLESGTLDEVLGDARLTLVYGHAAGLAAVAPFLESGDGSVLIHEAEMRLADAEAAEARRLADRLTTYGRIAPERLALIGANMRANLPSIAVDTPLSRLAGLFRGEPVVVAGAGPSLTHAADSLRRYRDHVRVVAVEAAVNPLHALGVRPDLAVSVDPYESNARQCAAITQAPPLVYLPSVHPSVPAHWPAARAAALPDADRVAEAMQARFGIGTLSSGGIVGTAAAALAEKLGARVLLLIGMDLAFSGRTSHAPGAFHARVIDNASALPTVPAVGGGRVPTNDAFRRAMAWFESFAARHPAGFCREMGVCGALKEGWIPTAWEDLLAGAQTLPDWSWPVPEAPRDLGELTAVFESAAGTR